VDIVTLGQYLQPTASTSCGRFYTPEEFGRLHEYGGLLGFSHVEAVRWSDPATARSGRRAIWSEFTPNRILRQIDRENR